MESLSPAENQTPEAPPVRTKKRRLAVPVWVAFATLLLGLLAAAVVIREISTPLRDLLFGADPEVPVPDNSTLIEEAENRGSARREWLYGSTLSSCEVARFYERQEDTDCVFSPTVCTDRTVEDLPGEQIGSCTRTVTNSISGYSWSVDISNGTGESKFQTYFRVYLFE